MATEILVNDGGAPARILPYTAQEAISAGDAVSAYTTAGQVQLADSDDSGAGIAVLGFALTDIAANDVGSIVTGKGVILMVQAEDLACGIALMMGSTTPGRLTTATNAATAANCVAVTLENNSAAGLTKVQTV
tara:strand:+ start:11175 stop:11573 length:399 start_codon:yes stop_codon:yes gene_type:complete